MKGYYYKNGYKEIDTYMIKEWNYYNLYLVLGLIYSFVYNGNIIIIFYNKIMLNNNENGL